MKHINSQLVLAMLMSSAVWGCSSTGHQPLPTHVAEKNLIFNPDWTGLPVFNIARTAWPTTIGRWDTGEMIEYQETIVDRQGRFINQPDFHYRRFDSVRSGRLHR